MKKINVSKFLDKYLEIQRKGGSWQESCSYYEDEKSQHDIFARRVNNRIVQPFFSKFKVVAFSYVKKDTYTYARTHLNNDAIGPHVHWALFLSFSDFGVFNEEVTVTWFDLVELRIKTESFSFYEFYDVCFYDASKDIKKILPILKLHRELISEIEKLNNSSRRENLMFSQFLKDMYQECDAKKKKYPSHTKINKEFKKLSAEQKDSLWNHCIDQSGYNELLSTEEKFGGLINAAFDLLNQKETKHEEEN